MVVCFKPTGAVPPPEGTPTADLDQHGGLKPPRIHFCSTSLLHLCALKMRMEQLLFAYENAPEWAFISVAKKRKGVKKRTKLVGGF